MKLTRFRSSVPCALVLAWLAFCCMGCDPDWETDPEYSTDIAAYKPDKVDSLELRITYQAGDTVWADTSVVQDSVNRIVCRDTCDSLFSLGRENKVSVDISFYCGDKVVALPTYEIDSHSEYWKPDDLNFRFVEFDERSIAGDYEFDKFLPPEDTSCGKFVNYAALRLKCSHGWCY